MRVRERTVNAVVAVRTAGREGLGIVNGSGFGNAVAVDACPRLIRDEQIIGRRTMRNMTETAVLDDGGVLEHERSTLGLMTLGALVRLETQPRPTRFVGSMTIDAPEHAFGDGVMGRKVQLRSHVLMAFETKVSRIVGVGKSARRDRVALSNVKRLPIVRVVTIGAEKTSATMLRRVPVQ